MKAADFRSIALSLSEASEGRDIGHRDFRVGGKIFATLGYPNKETGVIMLLPEEQERFIRAHPDAFGSVKGAWGRGYTTVVLEAVDAVTLGAAMVAAWRRRVPARLLKQQMT